MSLFFLLLVLGVVGVVVAVAAGRITGGLDEAVSSLPARGLPAGPISADDLEGVRFSPALRGYRMREVDAVLDRVTEEVRRLQEELRSREEELRLRDREPREPGPAAAGEPRPAALAWRNGQAEPQRSEPER